MDLIHGQNLAHFYAKKSVFITGVTGFVGKAIVEKLLRSCQEVEHIYVLVRGKLNKTPTERLQDILKAELFERVRGDPNLFQKVTAIGGDVTLDGLGISHEEADILKANVSMVFHVAGNVKFTAGLEDLLKVNTQGTKNVIEWAKNLRDLKAFVYMSTAFSNSEREEILEKVYPIDVDPHLAMKLYSGLPPTLVDSIASKLIGEKRDCYTFSKHLAEILVQEARFDLPVCIVRPTIVTAAHVEPFPGWVDNFNGMGGFVVGIGKGIIRCVYTNKRGTLDIVPVDHVVNLSLAAGFLLGSDWIKAKEDVMVYHCSSTEHPYIHEQVTKSLTKAFEATPFNQTLWYPSVVYVRSIFIFTLLDFFLHYVPAVLMDGLFKIVGKKQRMLAVNKKTSRLAEVLKDIQRTYYSISTENTKNLYKLLSPADQQCFNFDIAKVDWGEYMLMKVYGLRRYALKQPDEDLLEARKQYKFKKLIYVACCGLLVLLLLASLITAIIVEFNA